MNQPEMTILDEISDHERIEQAIAVGIMAGLLPAPYTGPQNPKPASEQFPQRNRHERRKAAKLARQKPKRGRR